MSVEIQEKKDNFEATDYFSSRNEAGDVACFKTPEELCAGTITETKPKPAPSSSPASNDTPEAPASNLTAITDASVRMTLSQAFIIAVNGGLIW